ncbi:hypothetical protein AGMMS49975_23870 [Clostridia bacterium]|nr:hypothetical protein AGMMS49975_23870 [Clostridia bacterium]
MKNFERKFVIEALGLYTDKLNENEQIDLGWFKKRMNPADFDEFKELIRFVKIAKSVKATNTFDNLFKKIDAAKVEL